jgi:3-deoxy-D-manno-octulosonic-acid transferase
MALSPALYRTAQALYRNALRALRVLSPVLMKGETKLARGLRGRRHAHERLLAWGGASANGRVDRPVVWVHASSVGESIQARAVIDVLRGRIPGLQVVLTFFSPSAEGLCGDFPADVCSYLPWDLPEVMGPVLDAVQPSVIVFTQREVWPTLADEAAARAVPTVLIAGTLPEEAGRLSGPGRILLGPAFRSLRVVAAVSKEDGERFGLLGVTSDCVTVTGDPGIDAARGRVASINREAPHMRIFGDGRGPILVAGSTWPSDEEVLLPALARVRESIPRLRIVLAPHEPDGYDFAGLGRRLAADGWTTALLREAEDAGHALEVGTVHGADAILVDRVGVLAELYTLASVAYVGGGFHQGGFRRGGLHSVLEPAAAGVPVLVGPWHQGSVHATRLLAAGGARAVADAEALAHALGEWLEAPKKNQEHAQRAMDYIENHRGSAGRTADLITPFFTSQARPGTLSEGET